MLFFSCVLLVLSFFAAEESYGIPIENNNRLQLQRQLSLPIRSLPKPDGFMHVYALPVGQGDSHVVQCPSGSLSIIDLGSSEDALAGYWATSELISFLKGQSNLIRNVILTHNHYDHYSFIPTVLNPDTLSLSGLVNFYAACNYDHLVTSIKGWLNKVSVSKLRSFNNGQPCGSNGRACEKIDLCPDDPKVSVKVMSANLGQQCSSGNKNVGSLVFKITYGSTSILFNGDFEDYTSASSETGPQKALVDYYRGEMKVTVLKLSHHGAQNLANKPVSRDAHAPKATFVSGNPWYSYSHPRCDITDAFIKQVKSLCKPSVVDSSSPFYCGLHPYDLPAKDRVQRPYSCGFSGSIRRTDVDNEYATFSTIPDESNINVVELVVDGSRNRWGFVNNFMPKIIRKASNTIFNGTSDKVVDALDSTDED